MPTYIREETEGSPATTQRLPASGKNEAGNAQALPVASKADIALTAASQPALITRELERLTDFAMIMFHTERLLKTAPTSLNEVQSIPHVLQENMESDISVISTLPSAGPVNLIGQVFRASLDNADHVILHLGVDGAGVGLFVDDFESYANDAALQAVWVASDAVKTQVTLYTLAPHGGSQSMRINVTKTGSVGDTVTDTFAVQDWSAVDVVRFWARSDQLGDKIQLRVRVGDGTSSKSALVEAAAKDTWEEFSVNLAGMTNDGAFSPDMSAITMLEWEVTKAGKNGEWIVDDLSVEGDAGTARVRLFNVASASPGTLGSQVGTDQTIQLNNRFSDRYVADFGGAGVTIGNHYALVVDSLSASVDVTGLGDTKAGGGYYTNGVAFTSTDGGTTLTTQANDDLAFCVFGQTEGYLLGLRVRFNGDANGTQVTGFIENQPTEKLIYSFGHDIFAYGTEQTWFWPTAGLQSGSGAIYVAQGQKVELQVQWADNTPATELSLDYLFTHKPVSSWG